MTRQEALNFLGLGLEAPPVQIQATLFQYYRQLLNETLPAFTIQQLHEVRATLLNAEAGLATNPEHLLANAAYFAAPAQLPAQIYVLLYQQDAREAIHTLRVVTQEIVLAFENEFTARKYGQTLRQQHGAEPWSEAFTTEEILDFCEHSGYGLMIVPQSEMVCPPLQLDSSG